METTTIIALVYLAIGAVVTFLEMECVYKDEVQTLEKKGELSHGMYSMTVMMFLFFWPLLVAFRYWTLTQNCKRGVWRISDGNEEQ